VQLVGQDIRQPAHERRPALRQNDVIAGQDVVFQVIFGDAQHDRHWTPL
jgi:hypothetical protein